LQHILEEYRTKELRDNQQDEERKQFHQ